MARETVGVFAGEAAEPGGGERRAVARDPGHERARLSDAEPQRVAGARSHSGPCREAAKEIGSSVPWVGFPVGYAVSGVLLTVFGYFAMVLSQ